MSNSQKIWLVVIISAFLLWVFFRDTPQRKSMHEQLTEEYAAANSWRDLVGDETLKIGRALVKNGIQGCGTLKIKPNSEHSGEYSVKCTRDDINWRYYEVWPATGYVMGPYPDEATLMKSIKY